jgi:hypothetical protein
MRYPFFASIAYMLIKRVILLIISGIIISDMNLFVASQAQGLALYSYGMAIMQRCGQTVVVFLSLLLGINGHNLRQWFKEFAYEKAQKRGEKRREIGVKE